MKRWHGGMSTAAVHVRWPVLMFVFSGGVYTLQMSWVMPPSVISPPSLPFYLSTVLRTLFSLSVSIWVSLLKFKHLAPKQPFVSNIADRDHNRRKYLKKWRWETHRGRKKTSCMFDSTFCCLVSTHTHQTPSCLVTGCALAVPLGHVGSLCMCVCLRLFVCVCWWVRGVHPMPTPPIHPHSLTYIHTPLLSLQSYRWCTVQLHFHHCDDECSCQTPGNQSHICSCLCRHSDTAEVCTTTSTRPGGNNGWHKKNRWERERERGRESPV